MIVIKNYEEIYEYGNDKVKSSFLREKYLFKLKNDT